MKTIVNWYTREIATDDNSEPKITEEMINDINRLMTEYPNAYGVVLSPDGNMVMIPIAPLNELFPNVKEAPKRYCNADEIALYRRVRSRRIACYRANLTI